MLYQSDEQLSWTAASLLHCGLHFLGTLKFLSLHLPWVSEGCRYLDGQKLFLPGEQKLTAQWKTCQRWLSLGGENMVKWFRLWRVSTDFQRWTVFIFVVGGEGWMWRKGQRNPGFPVIFLHFFHANIYTKLSWLLPHRPTSPFPFLFPAVHFVS